MNKQFFVTATLFLLLIPFLSFSQIFGLKAGYTLSDMLVKDENGSLADQMSMRSTFHFGMTSEFPVNDNFSIETVLLLANKGASIEESETYENMTFSTKADINLFYLDIPVYAKAYADVNKIRFYGMLGPYVGVGLSGTLKMEGSAGPELYSEEEDISWGSGDEDDLKRLAFGIALGVGAEVNSFRFEFSSHLGLSNLSPHSEYDMTLKNRTFMFTAGYKF